MTNECDICPLVHSQKRSDKGVLLQTHSWTVVLDQNQEYLGKSFVTLRHHKETITDLSSDEWNELKLVINQMEIGIKKAFDADVLNWMCLMNNAVASHQKTHVHWHLHPRYLNGVHFMGEDFDDPKWPLRRESIPNIVSNELYAKIADKIQEQLNGNQ